MQCDVLNPVIWNNCSVCCNNTTSEEYIMSSKCVTLFHKTDSGNSNTYNKYDYNSRNNLDLHLLRLVNKINNYCEYNCKDYKSGDNTKERNLPVIAVQLIEMHFFKPWERFCIYDRISKVLQWKSG